MSFSIERRIRLAKCLFYRLFTKEFTEGGSGRGCSKLKLGDPIGICSKSTVKGKYNRVKATDVT